jgi:hypothetical protein
LGARDSVLRLGDLLRPGKPLPEGDAKGIFSKFQNTQVFCSALPLESWNLWFCTVYVQVWRLSWSPG